MQKKKRRSPLELTTENRELRNSIYGTRNQEITVYPPGLKANILFPAVINILSRDNVDNLKELISIEKLLPHMWIPFDGHYYSPLRFARDCNAKKCVQFLKQFEKEK